MRRIAFLSLPLLLLIAGCTRVNPRPAFKDVATVVQNRTDQKIAWARTPDETAQNEKTVRQLLSSPLNVDSAVQIALLNNRRLQTHFEEIGISQADLVQAGLLSNPEFGLSILLPSHSDEGNKLEFEFGLNFLDFIVLSPRKKLAVAELERTKLEVAGEVLDLVTEVKEAFYTLQAAQQFVNRMELIVDINETGAEFALRQFEGGTLGELDLANHRAAYQQSRVDLTQARMEVRTERERLNRLLGLWGPDTAWTIEEQLPPIPDPEIPVEQLEALAMTQRFDLQAARVNVNILRRALSLTKGTRFLPVGVHVGVASEREPDGLWLTGPTLGLQLPIFDQGQASVARMESMLIQSQRELEYAAVNARSSVREAVDMMLSNRDLTEYYGKVLLPQRVEILGLTQRHYNMMLKGAYDLLLAKQDEVEAERSYIEAWRDYWLARTELERALGGALPHPGAAATVPEPPAAANRETVNEE